MKRSPGVIIAPVLRQEHVKDWWTAVCTDCLDCTDTSYCEGPIHEAGFPYLVGWAQTHLLEHQAES